MNINTVTFVAPNWPVVRREEGASPQPAGCNRRARQPQSKFGATLRAAVLFGARFVARSSQTAGRVCSSLAPRLRQKSLAANVTIFMFMTTKVGDPYPADRRGAQFSFLTDFEKRRLAALADDELAHPRAKGIEPFLNVSHAFATTA
jgi:hypothetical protein